MTHYLIEFRFSGHAKQVIRELKTNITKNFGVSRRKIVPHITLAGPLHTNDEKRLVKEIVDICKKYESVKFKISGFDNFENRVIYVNIKPSEELQSLRLEIAEQLYKFCELSEFDTQSKFTFHATLVFKDIQRKFDRIWNYLQSWKIPEMNYHVIRVTIIKNQRILAEYDLEQRKLLDRRQALDKKTYQKTIKKLDKKLEPSKIQFKEFLNNEKISVFSDAHFDHKNIIRYCKRPFDSIRQMNKKLLDNWNNSINETEKIFFLGDMVYGRRRKPIDYWLGRLNGDIFYIRGNHDTDIIEQATVIPNHYGIKYNDYEFLLMHDPYRPKGYDGWIIHGDKHNNNLKEFPFINQKNKTVNVCAELVNYTPLTLDRLILLIETGRNFKTING